MNSQQNPELPAELERVLNSPVVSPATRRALAERLLPRDAPSFFTATEWNTLLAVCARLISPDLANYVAGEMDARLKKGEANGWRYDVLPPDGEAIRTALAALEARDFSHLDVTGQEGLLSQLRDGQIPLGFPHDRFFEELLAEAVEYFVSHPRTQLEMGYRGFADLPGWHNLGLNGRDVQESGHPAPPAPRTQAPTYPMRHYPEDEVVDALIIGTGPGGAPLLWRLASAGLKVVALEAGKWWNPAEDFATDERHQRFLFWNDERLSAGDNPIGFGNNNSGTGVGGTTLHYTAFTPRAHPDDFCLYSDFGVGVNWPLGYADIEPYYAEVEAILGVSGPKTYPWGPPRQYPSPPLPLNGPALLMERGCNALGIRTSPAANAALSSPYFIPGLGWRAACTNRGFCQAGCTVGAKASMDVTFIPLAVAAGAEIRPECFVTRIETRGDQVTGVVYIKEGMEHRQRCRALFLCAGAIETPRLLLLNQLALDSGQVGRNFMAHPGVQVWGEFEAEVRPWKGIPASLISEDTHRPQARWPEVDFAGGYLLQSIGVMPVTYASQYARSQHRFGAELREHINRYNHFAGIDILGDCLPYPENFVELAAENDDRGLPKPRVHFTAGENERKLSRHAESLMREIWRAAGGRNLWAYPRFAHIIGTCRMGDDPVDSVVNSAGRSHEISNLYVCDNSVFPSALSVNPSLTIMALSMRTADKFLA